MVIATSPAIRGGSLIEIEPIKEHSMPTGSGNREQETVCHGMAWHGMVCYGSWYHNAALIIHVNAANNWAAMSSKVPCHLRIK